MTIRMSRLVKFLFFTCLFLVETACTDFCFFFLKALASLGKLCIAAVQAYDTSTESIDALNAAEMKLNDIINSPSLDAACRKIDSLAEKNQLDSALVLMITKAWSAAKESNMMKDEVLSVMILHFFIG